MPGLGGAADRPQAEGLPVTEATVEAWTLAPGNEYAHNGVVEIVEVSSEVADSTRSRVARSLLTDGPATATVLAERLGLTPAAVRRHLDTLAAAGQVEARDRSPYGPTRQRGRGRPAKVYALTAEGREAFPQAYDRLAAEALHR